MNKYSRMMEGMGTVTLKCKCGHEMNPILNEYFDFEDEMECECGRVFIIKEDKE